MINVYSSLLQFMSSFIILVLLECSIFFQFSFKKFVSSFLSPNLGFYKFSIFNLSSWIVNFQKQPQKRVADNNGSCKGKQWQYLRRCHFVRNLLYQVPAALLVLSSFLWETLLTFKLSPMIFHNFRKSYFRNMCSVIASEILTTAWI